MHRDLMLLSSDHPVLEVWLIAGEEVDELGIPCRRPFV